MASLTPSMLSTTPRTLDLRSLGPDYTSSPGLVSGSVSTDASSVSSAQTEFSPPPGEDELEAGINCGGYPWDVDSDECEIRRKKLKAQALAAWPFLRRANSGEKLPRSSFHTKSRIAAQDQGNTTSNAVAQEPASPLHGCDALPPSKPALMARQLSTTPSPLELPSPFPTPSEIVESARVDMRKITLDTLDQVQRVLGELRVGESVESPSQ